jgi:hypothetical protein
MNWLDIKTSADNTHFLFEGVPIFGTHFIEVLKFHSPGLAPVRDETGSYHIDCMGKPLYKDRYSRTFGYYFNRAAVVLDEKWVHLNEKGHRAYMDAYSWTGNFQENLCPVRNGSDQYFHIDLNGKMVYATRFIYAGDFKDGIACVKTENGLFRHIDRIGDFINKKAFLELGVFHKNFATAKDFDGWHHIDRKGNELYKERYAAVEPFYNGFALVTGLDNKKSIINEQGALILSI